MARIFFILLFISSSNLLHASGIFQPCAIYHSKGKYLDCKVEVFKWGYLPNKSKITCSVNDSIFKVQVASIDSVILEDKQYITLFKEGIYFLAERIVTGKSSLYYSYYNALAKDIALAAMGARVGSFGGIERNTFLVRNNILYTISTSFRTTMKRAYNDCPEIKGLIAHVNISQAKQVVSLANTKCDQE